MKINMMAFFLMLNSLFISTAFAVVPSAGIEFRPIDSNGQWDGTTRNTFAVGEQIEFHNKYKLPFVQQDGWKVYDSNNKLMFGCNVTYNFNFCRMDFWGDNCTDDQPRRVFDTDGTYRVRLLSTAPDFCSIVVDEKFIIIGTGITPPPPPQPVTLVKTQTDLSEIITVSVFEVIADQAQQRFKNFAVKIPPEYVVIGGGVEGDNSPGQLITASYPNSDLTAWLVSTKDHAYVDNHRIKAYAIGMKVNGLTPAQLRSHISINKNTSSVVQHPDISVAVPAEFKMIGGGFNVNWTGAGNLATSSYPVNASTWRARSKDHMYASPAALDVYALGIREFIPGIGQVVANINSVTSASAQHPSSAVNVTSGNALAGCGAHVNWSGGGNLLWKLVPAKLTNGCVGASKDHGYYSPATISTYSIGVRMN